MRTALLVLALGIAAVGAVGLAVHKDTGGSHTALSTSTTGSTPTSAGDTGSTAGPGTASTAAASTTASTAASTPSSTTASTAAPTTEVPRGATGSGLNASGTGQVAAGRSPTPNTGAPGWLLPAGLAALFLAAATRRLARMGA